MKILKKITDSRTLFSVLFIFFFLSPSVILSNGTTQTLPDYYKLLNLYQEYFKNEEELFERSTFKLSDKQLVSSGSSFKLTLEDDRGGKWIFKDKGTNRIIAHRIYALFGMASPEIHQIQISLNGKLIKGTLQKFISSAAVFSNYKPSGISRKGLEYIMKAQVIDWLIRDHDANMLNFLVLSLDKEDKVDGLIRIDQDCACLDKEFSDLDYVHMVAIDKNLNRKTQGNYYCLIQDAFTKKEIELDLANAYAFVKFIADFPADLLEEAILPIKSGQDKGLTKENRDSSKKRQGFFWEYLFSNKRNIEEDFKNLYVNLAASRNEKIDLSKSEKTNNDIVTACDNFKKATELLKKNNQLQNKPGQKVIKIEARASLDGFYIMQKIYEICWYNKGDLPEECREALKKLRRLKSKALANERKAIDVYVSEVNKILAGKGMTFPINQINKLVDPVLSVER